MRRHPYLLMMLAGCRFAGPDGELAILPDEPELDARVADGADARLPTGDSTIDAAVVVHDAAMRADASEARPDAAVVSCAAPPNLACDPVEGGGCLPLMQCLADPASSTPAVYCVFGGLQLGPKCAQDAFSTNCPPQHSCVDGACRKYCYCDADCDGTACSDAFGASQRFKLCSLH